MTNYEKWLNELTVEQIYLLFIYGFDCRMCPAKDKCKNDLHMCNNYNKFCEWLESEAEEN